MEDLGTSQFVIRTPDPKSSAVQQSIEQSRQNLPSNSFSNLDQMFSETSQSPTHNIPLLRSSVFVAPKEFVELQDKLSLPGSRVVLTGLGGVGKSQLAIEHSYRVRDGSSNTWVLWIHASNAARFDQDVWMLVDDIKLPGRKEKDADTFQLLYNWLYNNQRRWLIVLDNADDADFLFERPQTSSRGNNAKLRIDYIPICSHGSLLVTTRSWTIASRLVNERNIVNLRPNRDHAIALLKNTMTQPTQAAHITDLAAALEYMPLAITQAAAYIKKRVPRYSIEEYILKLERSNKSKSSLLKGQYDRLLQDRLESKNSILRTWQISFEHIYSTRQSAANLLSIMSFFDYQGIPKHLVQPYFSYEQNAPLPDSDAEASHLSSKGSTEDAFDTDIETLRDYSLISITPEGSTFKLHRLVHLIAQMQLKEKDQYQLWEARSLQRLDNKFPRPDHDRWKECYTLYPHAALMLQLNPQRQDALLSLASILYKAAWFADDQGLYAKAEVMARQSVNIREGILGPKDIDTLISIANLASVYWNQGRWKEAEETEAKVMDAFITTLGPSHPYTLTSMAKLASMFRNQGRLKEAEGLQTNIIEKRRAIFGSEHPETLMSITNLASTYTNQGRWKEAEELELEVMETMEKVLGSEHPDTLTSITNLASTYINQGRWKEAEELELKVMETMKKVLGSEHPDTLTSMTNLASTYMNQGRWKEAEELELKVMETMRIVLGPEHPDTLTSIASLASTYWNQGRWKEAEELELEVMETRRTVLGPEHPDTLTSINNLASTYWNQGRWKEAEELELEVMETMRKVLGPEHPDTLTSINNLASTYMNQGRWKEAEELELKVMETRRTVLGPEHPDTLISMNNLAGTYRYQGRWEEAEELQTNVMEKRRAILGPEHPDTLTSIVNLASTYHNQGRWKEAEELGMEAIGIQKRVLGPEHPSTLRSMANLAGTYGDQGRWMEAEELEKKVLELRQRVLGPEHPSTLKSMNNLAITYYHEGRMQEAQELMTACIEAQTRVLGATHPDTDYSVSSFKAICSRIESDDYRGDGIDRMRTTELIEKGTDVNAQEGQYSSALQAASNGGHAEIVKLLLENGADVNAQGGQYSSALRAASNGGHAEIVKLLLENGADVNA